MWQALHAAASGPSAGYRAKLARAGPGQIGQAWGCAGLGQAKPAPWQRGGTLRSTRKCIFSKGNTQQKWPFPDGPHFRKSLGIHNEIRAQSSQTALV